MLLVWWHPLVTILELEQSGPPVDYSWVDWNYLSHNILYQSPIGVSVPSCVSNHVRAWPSDPVPPLKHWNLPHLTRRWLSSMRTFISSANQWRAGIAFKGWRKNLMMVPGLSIYSTSMAPLANRNMSNGNLKVHQSWLQKGRKVLLNFSNTSLPQWITLCLNGVGSISWKMSIYAQVKPQWAHRMHLWPCWPMWFSLQWREGKEHAILICLCPYLIQILFTNSLP